MKEWWAEKELIERMRNENGFYEEQVVTQEKKKPLMSGPKHERLFLTNQQKEE